MYIKNDVNIPTHRYVIHMLGYTTLEEEKSWNAANVKDYETHHMSKCHFMISMLAQDHNNHTALKDSTKCKNGIV